MSDSAASAAAESTAAKSEAALPSAAPAATADSTPGPSAVPTMPPKPSAPGQLKRTSSSSALRAIPEAYTFPEEIEAAFTRFKEVIAEVDKATTGILETQQVHGAITRVPDLENELSPEAIRLAIEQGDTDGTGDKINHAKVPFSHPSPRCCVVIKSFSF